MYQFIIEQSIFTQNECKYCKRILPNQKAKADQGTTFERSVATEASSGILAC